ncbi:hypothetical protein HR12_23595 [Microbacterium sp. SUBG005]|nr:hypothetical protein HR12_23595 [Microbacterium sp. SUBG005]
MERRAEQCPLFDRDDAPIRKGCQWFGIRAPFHHRGRADEHGVHRRGAQRGHLELGLERLRLGAEDVARDAGVDPAERALAGDGPVDPVGEEDETRACAVHRHPARDGGSDRVEQAERPRELVDDARLAAGEDEALHGGELLGPTHGLRVGAEGGQHGEVLAHVALQGEDADAGAVTSHARPGGAGRGGRRR